MNYLWRDLGGPEFSTFWKDDNFIEILQSIDTIVHDIS